MRKFTIAIALVLLLATVGIALGANESISSSQGDVISLSEANTRSQNNSSTPEPDIDSEDVDNGNFLSNAVSAGNNLFVRGLVDGIYADIYAEENGTEFTNTTEDGIYRALVDVPNPYENKNVVELYGGYLNMSLYLSALFVIGAIIGRSLERTKLVQRHNMSRAAFIGGIALCGLAMIANILFAGALELIEALNNFIALPALPAMAPDPDSLLVYIAQGICDGVLLVFFTIRYYVIHVAAVACSIIIVLLVPEKTREFATDCTENITRILFLQPAALFVYVVCLLSLDDLSGTLKAFGHLGTSLMVFLTCWYFLFGKFTLLKQAVHYAVKKGVGKV